MNIARLCIDAAGYKLQHFCGVPKKLPMNLTISVTDRCNSRCKTCNIWRKDAVDELDVEEYEKIFRSLSKAPVWFTLSGGEPFLRQDIVDISESIYRNNEPNIINIPTNGILTARIEKSVREILDICKKTMVVVNLSLDGIGEDHDVIRGAKSFDKLLDTFERLSRLRDSYCNFTLGIHSVISSYNVSKLQYIFNYVQNELNPDSYITEIAEERVELGTIGAGITPNTEEYRDAIEFISGELKKASHRAMFPNIIKALRLTYYDVVKDILVEKRQIIPCYAGISSGQITPTGDVWMCCVRGESIGNLRDADYDFKRVWFSESAKVQRSSIKNSECYCPLANAHYTSMIFSPGAMLRVSRYLIRELILKGKGHQYPLQKAW